MYGNNVLVEPTRLKRTRADLEQDFRFEKGTASGTKRFGAKKAYPVLVPRESRTHDVLCNGNELDQWATRLVCV